MRSLRKALSRASVRSSSAPASRLKPAMSATRITVTFRASVIVSTARVAAHANSARRMRYAKPEGNLLPRSRAAPDLDQRRSMLTKGERFAPGGYLLLWVAVLFVIFHKPSTLTILLKSIQPLDL